MPITRQVQTTRISQDEFGALAYEVMGHVIDIHNEFGRFFDERVYKRELADRMPGIELEVPVTVVFGTFSKTYYLDVLVHRSGLFEFKAAEAIVSRHRSQAFNYLLLFDLPHGKIINVRPERVDSEFVNCLQRLEDLRNPTITNTTFDSLIPGAEFFRDTLSSLVHDWGAGLEIGLYDEALTHFLGGEHKVVQAVPVIGTKGHLHDQKMRMLAPDVAFKLTALADENNNFESHVRRFLQHTTLKAIHWANITTRGVTFTTLR
ncbi:MAG: GxxExxY protein [Verrucomicrobia bacterium]|nr:GxxExxY protein [Verrucomicrobiota bacterium]